MLLGPALDCALGATGGVRAEAAHGGNGDSEDRIGPSQARHPRAGRTRSIVCPSWIGEAQVHFNDYFESAAAHTTANDAPHLTPSAVQSSRNLLDIGQLGVRQILHAARAGGVNNTTNSSRAWTTSTIEIRMRSTCSVHKTTPEKSRKTAVESMAVVSSVVGSVVGSVVVSVVGSTGVI